MIVILERGLIDDDFLIWTPIWTRILQWKNQTIKHVIVTVAICFLIAVIEGLDIQAAGIAAAGIREYFGLDKSQLGVFFSAGILGLLPGALIGGRIVDRIGRKKVLDLVYSRFCFIYAVHGVGQQLQQLAGGTLFGRRRPRRSHADSDYAGFWSATPQNRGRAVGLMYCGMPVGAAILSLIATTDFGANWKMYSI